MKKARKKRIVRRKRRISEREIMRIKRKLKKSARKLRLGAKRTGAYVYGTLRRIVGNPGGRYRVGGGYKTFTLDEAKREAERIFRTTGNIVSIEEHRPTPQVAPAWKYGIYTGRGVVRKNPNSYTIRDVKSGDRIQLHPAHSMWMRGARYGTVVGVGLKSIAVKLDGVRKYVKIAPRDVGEIYPNRRLRGNPMRTNARKPRASDLARWRAEARVRDDKSRGVFWTTTKDYLSGPKYDPARWDSRGAPVNVPDWYRASLKKNPGRNYFAELSKAGVPMDHHESDLYVMDTPEARRILSDWPFGRLERFRNNINGKIYIDVPFGYMPYWERKMR